MGGLRLADGALEPAALGKNHMMVAIHQGLREQRIHVFTLLRGG